MRNQLLKVSSGFNLVYCGLMMVILAILITIVGVVLVGGGQAGEMKLVVSFFVAVAGMAILGSLFGLVGRIMCLATPKEASQAKSMILASVMFEMCSLLLSSGLIAQTMGVDLLPETLIAIGNVGSLLLSIISAIVFLLFARSLAEFLQRRDLARQAGRVIRLAVLTVLLVGGGIAISAMGDATEGEVTLILAGMVAALIMVIRYASLLRGMSTALRQAAKAVPTRGFDSPESKFNERDNDDKW